MVKTKHQGNHNVWREFNHTRKPKTKADLESSILSCLGKQRGSLKAVQIAKAIGMVTAKDVNPTLYSLAKVNKVVYDSMPPLWRLCPPLTLAATNEPELQSYSYSWTMMRQDRNMFPCFHSAGDANVSTCQRSPQHSYLPHAAGFQSSAVPMVHCVDRGIPTAMTVHQCRYVTTSPGVSVTLSNVDTEETAGSTDTSCYTASGEPSQPQQNLGFLSETQLLDNGVCGADEQSDEKSIENLMMSCGHGTEGDTTNGRDDPGQSEGHCNTTMTDDDVEDSVDDNDTSSDGFSCEEETMDTAILDDQVRLLRALSTSDDEQNKSCGPGDFSETRFMFNIGQSDSVVNDAPLQKRILQHMAKSPKEHCSTLHLIHTLQLGSKTDINRMLYDMNKHGLIRKVNDSPARWQITVQGRIILQSPVTGNVPNLPTSLAIDSVLMSQLPSTSCTTNPFRIPLLPAELLGLRSTGSTSGSSSPMGIYSDPLVCHRIGIGRGIQLVQNSQTIGQDNSKKLLNALKVHDPVSVSVSSSVKTGSQNTQEALSLLSNESFAALNKNPISALMEFAQSRKMTATIEVFGQTGPPHNPRFRMAAVVGGRQFPDIIVSNKKEGKKEAAEVAMRILMSEEHAPVGPQAALIGSTQATHFDKMAALCHQAFHLVISGIMVSMPGRKVMAGLVMKRGSEDDGKVICLGSGNRCITGESLSLEGQTVNDSHAEIITRRAFLRFLYRQLQAHAAGSPQTIFEEAAGGKLRVKADITFHLYITTAPCGDGALMSQRDSKPLMFNEDGTEHHPTFSSAVMGLLRTKIEGGEGTLPIKCDFVEQTWDGIVRGERLRTMSCSDKICRWNIVGMQGALLSHFLEPIYLSSLTLGYLYEESHLSRAVCCRLVHGEPDVTTLLPSPYHVNHPQLGRVTMCDAQRETQKTKQYSVNWCEGDSNAEVTDGTCGICLDGTVSRVCKSSLYKDFKVTCEKFDRVELLRMDTYFDAKRKATDFQEAKRIMVKKFKDTGFGMWVSKPVEEKMFS